MSSGALSGIRVIDLTTVLFGPYCTQMLGDLGADIIKIEGPGGDSTRSTGPARHPGMSAFFLGNNRNKRSICIDLKQPVGLEVALSLMASADVFISNVRPKALERLGLSYDAIKERNPRIVYCKAVGFDQAGPYADQPAFDDTIQAMSGTASLQAALTGETQYVASAVADKTCGLMLALAAMAALRHAERTGEGQEVEVPMFETMVSFNLADHLFGRSFIPPIGEPLYPRLVSKFRRPYKTLDGCLAVLPYNDQQWLKFFRLVGKPGLIDDARFSSMDQRTRNIDELYELLQYEVSLKPSAEWLMLLHENDIPVMPVKSTKELVDDDEQLKAIGFFSEVDHPSEGRLMQVASPIRMSATPPAVRRHAPLLGEHTAELLDELGMKQRDIDELVGRGVVRVAPIGTEATDQ